MKKIISTLIAAVVLIGAATGISLGIFTTDIPKTEITEIQPLEESFKAVMTQAEGVTGYQIEYSTTADFTKDTTKSLKSLNTECTPENLLGDQEYFVRARTYITDDKKTYYSHWSDSVSVTTKSKIALEKLTLTPETAKVLTNKTLQLNAAFEPENTSFKALKYSSSNPEIATVTQDGLVKGLTEGTVQITVRALETDKKAVVNITVEKPFVAATGIKITNKADLTVETGKTLTMTAQVLPEDATNQEIIWKTSDTSKATIDDKGVLTAIRPTEYVEVTASTKDGKFTAKYTLKITKNSAFLTNADLDKLNLSGVNNLMIVAHPDDETFWGGGHILNDSYLVVVLSNGFHEQRVKDFNVVINRYGDDKGLILSYPDTARNFYDSNGKYKGYETDYWSTCKAGMEADITLLLNYKKWDTVVTHNPDGEYNKYHHKQVSEMVTKCMSGTKNSGTSLYYFGHYYGPNNNLSGERLSDDDLEMKNQIIQMYLPTAQGAYDAFGHMLPYENWVLSSEW